MKKSTHLVMFVGVGLKYRSVSLFEALGLIFFGFNLDKIISLLTKIVQVQKKKEEKEKS
jgi:hypothetical protein